jgi:hypothetical protein
LACFERSPSSETIQQIIKIATDTTILDFLADQLAKKRLTLDQYSHSFVMLAGDASVDQIHLFTVYTVH